MKIKVFLIIMCLVCILVTGCSTTDAENEEVKKTDATETTEDLSKYIVIDGKISKEEQDKMITMYSIKNTSNKTFNGEIDIYLANKKGNAKDIASLEIENLYPNTTQFKSVSSGYIENPKFSHKIKGEFEEHDFYTSKYYHEDIFCIDGNLKTIFVLVENINKEELEDVLKEYKEKYKDKISTIMFFDKSQNVKIGENPFLKDIDEKASYTFSNDSLIIY